jgi:hypothetical protein
MDLPAPVFITLEWIGSNWPTLAGTAAFIALMATLYRKGLLGTLNARVDSDRFQKLYRESVQREQECNAARAEDQRRQIERDTHVRSQVTALQQDLDWLNERVVFLRSASPQNGETEMSNQNLPSRTTSLPPSGTPAKPLESS